MKIKITRQPIGNAKKWKHQDGGQLPNRFTNNWLAGGEDERMVAQAGTTLSIDDSAVTGQQFSQTAQSAGGDYLWKNLPNNSKDEPGVQTRSYRNWVTPALMAVDAAIPGDVIRDPLIEPGISYNEHAYGTGSQAIAKHGGTIVNNKYQNGGPMQEDGVKAAFMKDLTEIRNRKDNKNQSVKPADNQFENPFGNPLKYVQTPLDKHIYETPPFNFELKSSGDFGTRGVGPYGKQIAEDIARELGYSPTYNSIYRSEGLNNQLIREGAPAVKNSWHLSGNAVDITPEDEAKLSKDSMRRLKSKYQYLFHGKGKDRHGHWEPYGSPLPPTKLEAGGEMPYNELLVNSKATKNGRVAKYQNGTREPIYTSNPNDPRLRAYQDSLYLYKKTVNAPKYLNTVIDPLLKTGNFNDDGEANELWSNYLEDDRFIRVYNRLNKPNPESIHTSKYNSGFSAYVYKKPVKPIIYQEPTPKRVIPKAELIQSENNIDLGTIGKSNHPFFDVNKPITTNYGVSYRGDNGQQQNQYFPDMASWQEYMQGKDYLHQSVAGDKSSAQATLARKYQLGGDIQRMAMNRQKSYPNLYKHGNPQADSSALAQAYRNSVQFFQDNIEPQLQANPKSKKANRDWYTHLAKAQSAMMPSVKRLTLYNGVEPQVGRPTREFGYKDKWGNDFNAYKYNDPVTKASKGPMYQKGGELPTIYNEGDEVDLTEDEIKNLIDSGFQIKIL